MVGQYELDSHKTEDGHQTVLEVTEPADHVCQEKIHGSQAQNGKNIGTEHQKRVGSDGQNGRNAIQRKEDVGELNDHQCYEQGGRCGDMPPFDKEFLPFHVAGYRHYLPQIPINKGVFRIETLFLGKKHLKGREQQKCPEHISGKTEFFDDGDSKKDHERPKNDGTQDTPEQYPVLVALWDAERGKDDGDDKDIVNTQGQLNEVPGDILHGGIQRGELICVFNAPIGIEPIDHPGKYKGHGDPYPCPHRGFLNAYDMGGLVEHPKVQSQKNQYSYNEKCPNQHK